MPLVELTIYLTDSRFIEDSGPARLKVFDEAVRPTSTPVIIDALAVPEFLIEVEVWAAKA